MNNRIADPLFADKLTASVADLLTEAGMPGAVVALLLDGEPVIEAGVGFQNLGRTTPLPDLSLPAPVTAALPGYGGHAIVAVALANRDANDLSLHITHRPGMVVVEAL